MGAKHVPLRTCIGCGTARPKRELVRIVRTREGAVVADPTGRGAGRGAYLDVDPTCLDKGLAGGALIRALETAVSEEQRKALREEVGRLADERRRAVARAEQR